jgi:hypothetical protein
MTGISYLDVFSSAPDRGHDEAIDPGDLVRTGSNPFPHFKVIAVKGAMAWLSDLQTGADHLAPLRRCRKIGTLALMFAAE